MTMIFINFRNGDGDWAAKLIKVSLTRRFGENSVFVERLHSARRSFPRRADGKRRDL